MNIFNSKKIAIIGSGVVGQATGKGLAKMGHKVFFYDVNQEVIRSLNDSGYWAAHIKTLPEKAADRIDILMVSVSTPTIDGHIELNYFKSALRDIGKFIAKANNFTLVVLRSTFPPGTTEYLAVPILEKFSGKKVETDFGICVNPEFLREVNAEKDFAHPWIVVIGADDQLSGHVLGKVYEPFGAPTFYVSLKEAEMMKYAHNLLNATKISFFNEMRLVGEEIGVNPDVIFPIVVKSAEAMWNPEYGIKNFGPYGGMCLPKDTQAFFTWALETLDFEMPVLKGTIQTNELMKAALKKAEAAVIKESKKKIQFRSYNIIPVLKGAFQEEELEERPERKLRFRSENM
jgi:UDPglucose 6-dehydrogenase